MNIEEKLSAIKAINEEKEFIEMQLSKISVLSDVTETIAYYDGISFSGLKPGMVSVGIVVSEKIMLEIKRVIKTELLKHKEELIEKAKQLMK
jgi:hypothetical protein